MVWYGREAYDDETETREGGMVCVFVLIQASRECSVG